MDFLIWLVEWASKSTPLISIYFDTGYMAAQQYMMPVITQEVHDRLEAWVKK
jgi:hypothetical protein